MRLIVFAAIVLLCVALTCGVFSNFGISGIIPDLLICFIVSIALLEKNPVVLFMAAIGGLCIDVLYSDTLSLFAIPYLVGATFVLLAAGRLNVNDKVILPALLAAAMFMIKDFLCLLLFYVFGNRVDITYMLLRYSLPGAAVTGILTPLIYLLVRKLFKLHLLKRIRHDDFSKL